MKNYWALQNKDTQNLFEDGFGQPLIFDTREKARMVRNSSYGDERVQLVKLVPKATK